MTKIDPRVRLAELIEQRGETYAAVSRLLGHNASYIQQYLKRGSPVRLDETDIAQLALHFEIAPAELGGARSPDGRRCSTLTVPVLGLDGEKRTVEKSRQFDEAWLRRISDRPAGLAVVLVDGDAMNPTLQEGDEALIQRATGSERLRDGLYAIRGSSNVLIRRIALEPAKGKISVITDHPSFPTWNGLLRRSVDIVGRVVWLGLRMPG